MSRYHALTALKVTVQIGCIVAALLWLASFGVDHL